MTDNAKYQRNWRARNPDKQVKYNTKYRNSLNDTERSRARQPWTSQELSALEKWVGTARAFAERYGRSLQAVERKKSRLEGKG